MVQIIFNVWIYQSFGGKAMAYLLIGTFLSLGVHPIAGHFIAEHYMFVKVTNLPRQPVYRLTDSLFILELLK
jgi:hypothetical protein